MTTTREWCGLILETRIEYGTAARWNRGRYTGQKTHRLICDYVVGITPDAKLDRGTYAEMFQRAGKPVLFSAHPSCGCTQGQHAATPFANATADGVNCSKCLKSLNPTR